MYRNPELVGTQAEAHWENGDIVKAIRTAEIGVKAVQGRDKKAEEDMALLLAKLKSKAENARPSTSSSKP
jgi:hypothetical protein